MNGDRLNEKWWLERYSIGMKLRALRNRRRLTLSRLAKETGLSTALVSKLETDRMIPTLPTLATLCRVYGVGLGHFFSEPDHHSISITRRVYTRVKSRGQESVRIPLQPPDVELASLAEMIDLIPGGSPFVPSENGAVRVILYVIEGQLQIDSGAAQDMLDAGDCACIETQMPMAWSAAKQEPCRILVVACRPSEQKPAARS